jgi:hypothetical protein
VARRPPGKRRWVCAPQGLPRGRGSRIGGARGKVGDDQDLVSCCLDYECPTSARQPLMEASEAAPRGVLRFAAEMEFAPLRPAQHRAKSLSEQKGDRTEPKPTSDGSRHVSIPPPPHAPPCVAFAGGWHHNTCLAFVAHCASPLPILSLRHRKHKLYCARYACVPANGLRDAPAQAR